MMKASTVTLLIIQLLGSSTVVIATEVSSAEVPKTRNALNNDNKQILETTADGGTGACMADLQNKDGSCTAPNASTSSTTPSESNDDAPGGVGTTTYSPPDGYLECGLFLAESSIPNSGWGMYTGLDIKNGMVIPPVDVVIPVIDTEAHMTMLKHYKRLEQTMGSAITAPSQGFAINPYYRNTSAVERLPGWLMHQYYWDCSMTHNWYDAEHIDSVVPGLGMLANSHPGMILAENIGPARPPIIGGQGISSRSPYQDQSFEALKDLPAGHELFVEYGDSWFEDRFHHSFGLSDDYHKGNQFAQRWQNRILDYHYDRYSNLRDTMWTDLNNLMLETMEPMNPRLHEVVNRLDLLDTTKPFVAAENPTAYASVPNAPRSLDWLHKNGLCLDHITVADSKVAPGERGAFASRDLPKGTVVAPAPVVHMSRDHLTMLLLDRHDSDIVHWKGYQLLLNYVYGHVESSLLFFPYAPAVNLINHYHSSSTNEQDPTTPRLPNVKLQWSSKMPRKEWLESWTPKQIIEQESKAGLVMEIIALEDIKAGDEIVLDYGDRWVEAFEKHKATVQPPPELQSIHWNKQKLLTVNDRETYPSFVQTVCWINNEQRPNHFYQMAQQGHQMPPKAWLKWMEVGTGYLSDTLLCTIVGTQSDGAFYNVVIKETFDNGDGTEAEVEVRIQNIPRRAVTVVPNLYTSAELRRDGFRHEIQLTEDMVPEHWRDLKVVDEETPNPQCNLYMAESSIPNGGWGVYRGYASPLQANATQELDHFCEDMVIQVEDFEVNQMLRNRYSNQPADPEFDTWLLSQYALPGEMTKGNFDAENVQSFTPGCGMLANTHSLMYNTHRMPPTRIPSNATGPSLGASTPYHNAQFVEQYMKQGKKKVRTLQTGAEVLVKTSDSWFLSRVDTIGHVPLKSDYYAVDKVLRRFEKLKRQFGDEAVGLVWMLLWNTIEAFGLDRIASALPRDMNEVTPLLEQGGAAKYQIPDRVRSQEWLDKQGQCVDNIRPGKSTVKLADNGAIATRRLAKDSIIAPVPLIHVHRQHMGIYNSKNIYDPKEPVVKEGTQLILNYCYGHPESNLLLFPYSPVVNYINHAPTDGNKIVANAKLQWSSQFNTKEWLDKSPEDLIRHHKHAGLAMEVVATREIAQGEEVFIDYGVEWAEAWQNHTENWNLDERWRYQPPHNQWLDWMPTEDEIVSRNLFHQFDLPGKFLGCHVLRPDQPLVPVNEERGEKFVEIDWTQAEGMFRTHMHVYPCEVMERFVDTNDFHYALIRKDSVSPIPEVYSAIVTVHPGDDERPPLRFVSHNMPRRAIEIFDDEYAAPQYYRGAFRKEIGIPDDLVPDAWRDLKQSQS